MTATVNIDVNQKLSSSFHTKRPNITSNHPKFSEKIHIGTNSNPIKNFSNCPFSSIDPTIFPKAKLQFNIPTVKFTFPLSFKLTITYNISPYQPGFNI
jgi:hypothetical protein